MKEELGLYTSNQVHAFRKSSPQILAAAGASAQGMQARVHASLEPALYFYMNNILYTIYTIVILYQGCIYYTYMQLQLFYDTLKPAG